ncbi:MAG: hypothetical protein PHH60_02705 [Candidatus Margulisbacteria bacterium]|nr:hypothetical protein [Candidatus Margulisiibacteriota bacterium]
MKCDLARRNVVKTIFWGAIGLGLLGISPQGCRRNSSSDFSPSAVLDEIEKNPALQRMKEGKFCFLHKSLEGLTENGQISFSIIQRGLYALDLIKTSPDDFRFGLYGDETAGAVKCLQDWGGIDRESGWSGRKFGKTTLNALTSALELKQNDPRFSLGNCQD